MIKGTFTIKIKDEFSGEKEFILSKEELLKLRKEIDEIFPREKEIIYVPIIPETSTPYPTYPGEWWWTTTNSYPPPSEDD